ncbi:MAG: phosphoenolpyruvate--protein phosphotransferase, partial [Endomicrobia bacterium]|nr:phosphoenolpyruvate--protein phosphotransferase [Endomicrobiia bacterium]
MKKEKVLKGIPACEGIGIGKVFLLEREEDLIIPVRRINKEGVKKEMTRYKDALESTKKELMNTKERILKALGKQHVALVEAYVAILEDQLLTRDLVRMIEDELFAPEYALSVALNRIIQSFEKVEDEYFRGRVTDIRDVGRKLLRNLVGKERKDLSKVTSNDVVVAHTLSPHDIIILKEQKCPGFAVDVGTKTSHIALAAQGLEIPAVVGLKNITSENIQDGEDIIIDGYNGLVILNPEIDILQKYRQKYERIQKEKEILVKLKGLTSETVDNHKISLVCNIDSHREVEEVINSSAEGIGLFRTEYQYINNNELPSEKDLYDIYSYVAQKIYPYCVVIRTFDLGADKLSQLGLEGVIPEQYPALGLRGVRLALKYKNIFKTQIKAILRASLRNNVKIMFPMVSDIKEIIEIKKIVEEIKHEFKNEKVEFDKNIPIGVMIETPSAALTCDLIIDYVDFISIGTNDLIQYTLAVDRFNENVAELYNPLHLSILRLIKYIVDVTHKKKKSVSVCGEMAADLLFTKFFVGIG